MRLATIKQQFTAVLLLLTSISFSILASPNTLNGIPVTNGDNTALADFYAGYGAIDRGDFLAANRLFSQAVKADPNFAMGWIGLATAANSVEQFNDAVNRAAKLSDKVSDGEKMIIQINQTFISNDAKKRMKLSKKLASKYSDSPRAWTMLGNNQAGLNENKAARKSFDKAIKVDPNFTPAYSAMGFNYLFNQPKDFVKAEDAFAKVVKLEPDNEFAHINLGDVHRAQRLLEQALADYSRAASLAPNNGTAFTKKGHANSFLGNYSEARKDYDHAVKVAEDINKAFLVDYRAFVNIYEGKPDAAIDELGRAIKQIDKLEVSKETKNGAKNFALTNQATIALHHGMVKKAEASLTQRSNIIKTNIKSVNQVEFQMNQQADIAYWQGKLHARSGDFSAAQASADEIKRLLQDINNPRKMENYHDLLGLVALLKEDFSTAQKHYEKANPNNIYTKYHHAVAAELNGKKRQAFELYNDVAHWNFNTVGYALIRADALQKADLMVAQEGW